MTTSVFLSMRESVSPEKSKFKFWTHSNIRFNIYARLKIITKSYTEWTTSPSFIFFCPNMQAYSKYVCPLQSVSSGRRNFFLPVLIELKITARCQFSTNLVSFSEAQNLCSLLEGISLLSCPEIPVILAFGGLFLDFEVTPNFLKISSVKFHH